MRRKIITGKKEFERNWRASEVMTQERRRVKRVICKRILREGRRGEYKSVEKWGGGKEHDWG